MKTFRLFAAASVFAALFAVSAFAQVQPAAKIGLINTLAFDNAKEGITKYVTAMNSLETEFKPDNTTLQTLGTRIQTLQKEIEVFQKQIQEGKVPVDQKTVNTKVEEYDKLVREYKFKEEDAKARFQRREQALMGPIQQDIGKAMQEFAKQKGYTIILDVAKLGNAGLILAIGDDKADITKEFIQFYNTRPAATAAATTTPK
jgi:Skp family chaperone for outer membrane proteins